MLLRKNYGQGVNIAMTLMGGSPITTGFNARRESLGMALVLASYSAGNEKAPEGALKASLTTAGRRA